MKKEIKHIWFDMSDTIAVMSSQGRIIHRDYKYKIFANVTGKTNNAELQKEFDKLFEEKKSNSSIFYSLGKPKDFWAKELNKIDPTEIYEQNPDISSVLQKLRTRVPISLFTNSKPELILPKLGIRLDWFTHILDADSILEPKPSLSGFYKIIETTGLQAENILYVGDSEGKDIIPAKEVGMQTAIVWGKSDKTEYECEHFVELLKIV